MKAKCLEERGNTILELALLVAFGFVHHGAETFRAEDSSIRVLKAYGAERIEVMVMANFATIIFCLEGKKYYGQKRIPYTNNSMKRVEDLNKLTRHIVESTPPPEEVCQKVENILKAETYSTYVDLAITGFIGFSFVLALDGSIYAALFAFVIDAIVRLTLQPLYKLQTNRIFVNIAGGMMVSLLTGLSVPIGLGHEEAIIAGSCLMFLFPGVALVNSIRDIIASDYLAGATKLMQTILVAVAIAVGSGLGLSILSLLRRI